MIQQSRPTLEQLRQALQPLIDRNNRRGDIELNLPQDGFVEQDEWIHVILIPAKAGVRASDYIERLVELETDLKQRVHYDHILLVPARPE